MSNNGIDGFVWPTEFACTIITENIILPNVYSIHVGLEPITTNQEEIGLGFKKIKLFSCFSFLFKKELPNFDPFYFVTLLRLVDTT